MAPPTRDAVGAELEPFTADDLFRRASDVVFRVADDRVLVRHVAADCADGAELLGLVGVVWIALEPSSSSADLARELGVAESAVVESIEALVEAGWVCEAGA